MKNINMIVAIANNNVIGLNNGMPWHLPPDLKYFKEKTADSSIIMGRKCFESIGKPLPNRKNIVISSQDLTIPNVYSAKSIEKALDLAEDKPTFIIGGSQIYEQMFVYTSKLYITRIKKDYDGDTFFKGWNESDWILESTSDDFIYNDITYCFEIYLRK